MRTGLLTSDDVLPELAPEAAVLDVLRWAVAHGCRAPSELNTQPWRFDTTIGADGVSGTVDLLLDERRLLPAIDPTAREAVLACGAALLNVRLALGGAGLSSRVVLEPAASRPELLATVTTTGALAGPGTEPPEDRDLRLAVGRRSTYRGPFGPDCVPDELAERLIAEAAGEGAFVALLDREARLALSRLNRQAARALWRDDDFRRELAAWTRTNDAAGDGIPGSARGLSSWQSWLEPSRIRAGRPAAVARAQEREALPDAPLTLVIGSANDTVPALLRAGSGLQRVLLAVCTAGMSAGYLNAALHVSSLRSSVARLVGMDHPQVVLRIGTVTTPRPPTPRRHNRH